MKTVVLVNALSLMIGVAVLVFTFEQRHELVRLKAEAETLRARPIATMTVPPTTPPANRLTEAEKRDISRLRDEVTRLRQRQRELAGQRAENENLHAAAKNRQPQSAPPPVNLPPGYIRRRDAQFAGSATPEAAMQSFFWAIEHRDINALTQLINAAEAEEFRTAIATGGTNEFWNQAGIIPGFRVAGRETLEGNQVKLKVQFLPDDEGSEVTFRQEGNTWRLDMFTLGR